MKVNSMVGTERNRNNRFVNPLSLPWLSEISGTVHLVQPGLTTGSQADNIQVNLENFKTHCTSKHSTFRFVYPRYSIVTCIPGGFFWVKCIARLFF